MNTNSRHLKCLFFSLLAFAWIAIGCGKGGGDSATPTMRSPATQDLITANDTNDAKAKEVENGAVAKENDGMAKFALAYRLDKEQMYTAAKEAHFNYGNFNGRSVEDFQNYFTFLGRVDSTFAKESQFLYSRDLTFNFDTFATKENAAATVTASVFSKDFGVWKEMAKNQDFQFTRSSFVMAYGITAAQKERVGMIGIREGVEFFAMNAVAFRRVFAANSLTYFGITVEDTNGVENNASVERGVEFFKTLIEYNYTAVKANDAEFFNTQMVEIEKSIREFVTASVFRIDGKEFTLTVTVEKGGGDKEKLTYIFKPIEVTATNPDINMEYKTKKRE